MSTRSDIIVKLADGSWRRIYCHWDGYLEHNGAILAAFYNTAPKAIELTNEGDLSVLGYHTTAPDGHCYQTPAKGHCVYYGRDRGEKNTLGVEGPSLEAVWPSAESWTEYVYVWDGDRWLYTNDKDEPEAWTKLKALYPAVERFISIYHEASVIVEL